MGGTPRHDPAFDEDESAACLECESEQEKG